MSLILPGPPRFRPTEDLPRGPELWTPEAAERDGWTDQNTDGLWRCEIINTTLCLTKGADRGKTISLRTWQGDVIADMYRLRADGRRAFRTYELWIPKKNGKSLISSGLAIVELLTAPGGEAYAVASTKEQARITFKNVAASVEVNPDLAAHLTVYKDVIECAATGAIFRVLAAENAAANDGIDPSLVLFDELHAQANGELWEIMVLGSGTRVDPLVVAISTFGAKTDSKGGDSFAFGLYGQAKRVMSGEVDAPSLGIRIYETPSDADHLAPETHALANPAYGDFLDPDDFVSSAASVRESAFRTKRLNTWSSGKEAWLPAGVYESLADVERGPVPGGTRVVLSFDGSFNNDSTALLLTTVEDVPHQVVVGLWERPDDDPHWQVPMPEVEAKILEACLTWDVLEVCADPYRWAYVLQHLALTLGDERVVDFPQSPARMIPATTSFYEKAVGDPPGVTHDGDPRLVRHVGNAIVRVSRFGGQLAKDAATRKIDLAVCAVMGLARATFHHNEALRLAALPPRKPQIVFGV